nr:unnamed protein product [Callosobruchus analis]
MTNVNKIRVVVLGSSRVGKSAIDYYWQCTQGERHNAEWAWMSTANISRKLIGPSTQTNESLVPNLLEEKELSEPNSSNNKSVPPNYGKAVV